MDTKIIHYYTMSVYGNTLEYLKHPVDAGLIFRITGKKTITKQLREDITDLSGNRIQWVKAMA